MYIDPYFLPLLAMSDSLLTQAPQQRALQELLLCTRHLFPCPPPQLTNNTETFGSNGSGKQSLNKTSRKNLTYPTVVHFFFFFLLNIIIKIIKLSAQDTQLFINHKS